MKCDKVIDGPSIYTIAQSVAFHLFPLLGPERQATDVTLNEARQREKALFKFHCRREATQVDSFFLTGVTIINNKQTNKAQAD